MEAHAQYQRPTPDTASPQPIIQQAPILSPEVERAILRQAARSRVMQTFSAAAMAALILASISVIHYLLTTSYGDRFSGTLLLNYVIGIDHGGFRDSEALTVMATRFILVFSFCWPLFSFIYWGMSEDEK